MQNLHGSCCQLATFRMPSVATYDSASNKLSPSPLESLLFFFCFVLEEHKSWLLVVVVGLLGGETTELTCYDAEEE
jgi:hypothetical protein